jgi:hypothetical protein
VLKKGSEFLEIRDREHTGLDKGRPGCRTRGIVEDALLDGFLVKKF